MADNVLPDGRDRPRSTAAIFGHPIHPMLVPFPIAFWIGALITDVIYTQDFRFDELTITDSADGAVVEIYDGVFATVTGVAASQLTAADFVFAGHDAIEPDPGRALAGHAPVIPDLPLA